MSYEKTNVTQKVMLPTEAQTEAQNPTTADVAKQVAKAENHPNTQSGKVSKNAKPR